MKTNHSTTPPRILLGVVFALFALLTSSASAQQFSSSSSAPLPKQQATNSAQATNEPSSKLPEAVATQNDAVSNPSPSGTPRPNSPLDCREFPDVTPNLPYYEAVQYLTCKDFVRGNTDGLFHPERNVNRAEFATMLVAAFAWRKPLTPSSGQSFSDVPPSNAFFVAIETARAYGIINGYPDGTFRPWNPISRSEEIVILVNTAAFPSYNPPNPDFVDVPVGYWAYVAIETAYQQSVAQGNNGYFSPNAYAIRGDTARFIFKSANGPFNGMLGHCCRTSPEVGQYEGSNNMVYDYPNPSGPVQPIIPGGRMTGRHDYPYSYVKVDVVDIKWEPTALQWLKTHENDTYPNKLSASIVLHAFTAGTNGCTPGNWTNVYSNLPDRAVPWIKSACYLDNSEVRFYMNTMQNLRSDTTYSVHGEFVVDDSIGPGYTGSINVDNYWFQRFNDIVYNRDAMQQMCYSGSNLIPTWCR